MGNANQVDASPEVKAQMARHAQAFNVAELLRVIRIFNRAAAEARLSWQPALPLELAFVEALEKPAEPDEQAGAVLGNAGNAAVKSAQAPQAQKPRSKTASAQPAADQAIPQEFASPSEETEKSGASSEGAAAEGKLTMEMVAKNWRQILTLVRQHNPQTQGLLNSCKPLGIKDGVLYLGFNSDFTKSKMDKPEHIELAQQIMSQVLGRQVLIRCLVFTGDQNVLPPDVDSEGMVATAVRDLGGKIMDVQ